MKLHAYIKDATLENNTSILESSDCMLYLGTVSINH